jgi:hypothetical protein
MEQLAMLLDGHLDDAISSKRFFVTSGRPKVHFLDRQQVRNNTAELRR